MPAFGLSRCRQISEFQARACSGQPGLPRATVFKTKKGKRKSAYPQELMCFLGSDTDYSTWLVADEQSRISMGQQLRSHKQWEDEHTAYFVFLLEFMREVTVFLLLIFGFLTQSLIYPRLVSNYSESKVDLELLIHLFVPLQCWLHFLSSGLAPVSLV